MDFEQTKKVLAALEHEGVRYNVATPQQLYRMKKDTVRPKDWGDAELLRRRFRLESE